MDGQTDGRRLLQYPLHFLFLKSDGTKYNIKSLLALNILQCFSPNN